MAPALAMEIAPATLWSPGCPGVRDGASPMLEGITVEADPYAACEGADVLVVLTEWDEFAKLDPGRVGREMASRSVVDARNILDADSYRLFGFNYQGIGR